jgi:hypothetical protein
VKVLFSFLKQIIPAEHIQVSIPFEGVTLGSSAQIDSLFN